MKHAGFSMADYAEQLQRDAIALTLSRALPPSQKTAKTKPTTSQADVVPHYEKTLALEAPRPLFIEH